MDGTLTNNGATLRTYIYEVYNVLGQFVGWYPTSASNVTFAYSALGIPNPQNVTITGPNRVCIAETYTLNNVPSDFEFSWSISDNLGNQGTSGNSITVNKLSNGSGWVRATLTGHGCSIPITKDVQAGPFTSNQISILGQSSVCAPSCVDYYAIVPGGHQPGYTYTWTPPTGWVSCGQNENWKCLCPPSGWSGSGTVKLSVNNGCGASPLKGKPIFSSCGSSLLAYYPNPAKDEFTVSFRENSESEDSYDVKIFDTQSNLMYSTSSNQETITIPTARFPQGRYILNIIHKEGIIRRQIFISR